MGSMLFALVLLCTAQVLLQQTVYAHSYLTVPLPISNTEQCRMGGPPGFEENCPGPCPNYGLRPDTAKDMPSAMYVRGETYEIRYTKNNHQGGFLRLSLVPLDEMDNKDSHTKYAFYYSCWSQNAYNCNAFEIHRDCHHDFDNLSYKTQVRIPTVYPDGVYVLGFALFGGGVGLDSFGDYYDCAFVEIQGGEYNQVDYAVFDSTERHCTSQSYRIGDCEVEPCYEHETATIFPPEFDNGPPALENSWFEAASQRPDNNEIIARHDDFGINGFRLINSVAEGPMDLQAMDLTSVIYLDTTHKLSIEPVTFGHITYVQWFVNGKYQHDAKSYPWSIADHEMKNGTVDYYDWIFPYLNERCFISAIVHNDDRRANYSRKFSFLPKHNQTTLLKHN